MPATPPVRRSLRPRQTPKLEYEAELQIIAEKRRNSQESQSSESDDETDDDEMMPLIGGDDEISDSEEDFEPSKKKPTPKKPTPQKKNPSKQTKRTIQLKIGKKMTQRRKPGTPGRRGAHNALAALANRVLHESETPETSLMAALLASSKAIPGIASVQPRDVLHRSTTIYTPQLEGIARRLLQELDPNSLHIQVLNLLFRSVGGSIETNFKPDTDLEELTDDEWDDLMTEIVSVMRDGDDPLLTANPATTIGNQEYRSIYVEFWYRLGKAMLSHNSQETTEFTSNRFQVESIRDLISRLQELVMVGQPDLRAASTMAIWQLSIACIELTVELEKKLQVATRQSKASKAQNRKLQAVKHSMDAWKRNKAELEEIIEGSTFQGVFIHRYRDSNPQIRAESLEAWARIFILRPDLYLRDKYLKYFGWMASDKHASVRAASLRGLLAPFRELAKKKATGPPSLAIDIRNTRHVCTKFLNRFIDCTEDSESTEVQELAMELLLAMLQNEFLDNWEDEDGWDQINLKALDTRTTSKVRRDALYFILEQLHSFDPEDDNRSSMSGLVSDKKQVERLEGIASWVANKLCDGPIGIDKIRVHLADLLVESFREMPEHRHLVVNWSAMLKAIRSENPQQGRTPEREEAAKQFVLLRMLAAAAEQDAKSDEKTAVGNKRKGSGTPNDNQESLSIELLKHLPSLLLAMKGEIMALRSLTQLPKYLIPSAFSLPSRKKDFLALLKNLRQIFLEATDEIVLRNISQALASLVEGDHARIAEVRMHVKRLSADLQDRLMDLLRHEDPDTGSNAKSPSRALPRRRARKRSSRSTDGHSTVSSDSFFSASPEVDAEHSIYLCLLRWRMMLKSCPLPYLFGEGAEEDEEVEGFCTSISEAIGKKLEDRKPLEDEASKSNMSTPVALSKAWKTDDVAIHTEVARCVDEGLQVLLCTVAWKLHETLKDRDSMLAVARDQGGDAESDFLSKEVDDLPLLRMRNRLVNLIGMCFDQFLPDSEDFSYEAERIDFAASVQSSAARVASDIRVLFPREWAQAKDPVRKLLALTNDKDLVGGVARYFQSREIELVEMKEKSDDGNPNSLVNDLLLPLARSLIANWNDANRQEAALALCHITGSGLEAANVIHAMARVLKKVNPVRFLEAQMACLRMSFTEWLENEPDELETDRPTEEEMQEYEDELKRHNAQFHAIEQRASRLSQCLGVGKLSDPRLDASMLSFLKEGIRFAFEGNRDAEDDAFALGSRLPFLTMLSKYVVWVRKKKPQIKVLIENLKEREEALFAHSEFEEVHEDDLAALTAFKASLGVTTKRKLPQVSQSNDDEESVDENAAVVTTPVSVRMSAGSKRRLSTASSQRSRYSNQSNLSPLYEEDEIPERDEGNSPSPQKRRRLLQEDSSDEKHVSTVGNVPERIDEEIEDSEESSSKQ